MFRPYWGWIVCLCFLVLFTLAAGIAYSFTEIVVSLSKALDIKLSLLGKLHYSYLFKKYKAITCMYPA